MSTSTSQSSSSKVVVIGANRGIGFELAKQLQGKGHDVIATCRSTRGDLDQLDGVTVVEGVDTSKDGGLAPLVAVLDDNSVGMLIVNAGILKPDQMPSSVDELDLDGIREQFEVNSIGPLRATVALQSKLQDGGKVGLMTSRMGSIADNTSGGMLGYRVSKTALNQFGMCLAHGLKERNIAVCLLHPGFVRTDMTGGNGYIDADESASGLIDVMTQLDVEKTGTFWHTNGEELPW